MALGWVRGRAPPAIFENLHAVAARRSTERRSVVKVFLGSL